MYYVSTFQEFFGTHPLGQNNFGNKIPFIYLLEIKKLSQMQSDTSKLSNVCMYIVYLRLFEIAQGSLLFRKCSNTSFMTLPTPSYFSCERGFTKLTQQFFLNLELFVQELGAWCEPAALNKVIIFMQPSKFLSQRNSLSLCMY